MSRMYNKLMMMSLPFMAMAGGMNLIPQTPTEKKINRVDLEALVSEYKLIQKKESKLARSQRDMIEDRVKALIKNGTIGEDLSFAIIVRE